MSVLIADTIAPKYVQTPMEAFFVNVTLAMYCILITLLV